MRYLIAFLLCISVAACKSEPRKFVPRGPVQPSAKVKTFLGNSMFGVLSAPDSVQAILLEPRVGVAMDNIDGFKILSKGPMLTKEQAGGLTSLVLDEASYDFEHIKKHPMDPVVCYQFKKGATVVNVSVSFYGNLWQFSGFGEKKVEDNDPIRKDLLALTKQLFPADKDIQALEESP